MADPAYRNVNFILSSRGINARNVDDTLPEGTWLNEDNCEELAENSIGPRLGSIIVNRTGNTVNALPGGAVHSLAKLASISGSNFRYAGCGTDLYRRQSLTQGPYSAIQGGMSGNEWSAAVMQTANDWSAIPFIFIADSSRMIKDSGNLPAPQQMGIFQPNCPAQAAIQAPPTQVNLDTYSGAASDYTYGGISGGSIVLPVNTLADFGVGGKIGLNTVTVADGTQVAQFQTLSLDGGSLQETVLVLAVNDEAGVGTVIEIYCTKIHTGSVTLNSQALEITVPASTTATVAKSFGGLPIPSSETESRNMSDYVGIYLYVSDPNLVQSITIKFDCGDGTFQSDYFFKVVAQGPLQNLLNTQNDPTTAATDVVLADSLNLFGQNQGSISQLNSGLDVWTGVLCQLSDFAGAGRANYGDPVFNWANVNGYQVEVVTNDGGSATIEMSSLVLFGGAGPDTFAGVAYDYMFTLFNINDGTESNPSMAMTNVNPPNQTYWVYPRRMPVLVSMVTPSLDTQVTHARVYRRGGTLGDNYRRIAQVPIVQGTNTYIDSASDADIAASDFISFTNDVPVTSSLINPVNTTLNGNLVARIDPFTGLLETLNVAVNDISGISVGQQVSIGDIGNPDFETVIVIGVSQASRYFVAYVQNDHSSGEAVTATAKYGQPCNLIAAAYGQMWFAGDPNNPNYLYWSMGSYPQAVSSAAYVAVSTPDDPITAIVPFKGNLYVSTIRGWWAVAPGANASQSPIVYATACKYGCVAPWGWCATEEAIYYQAIDGLRAFAGGASSYLTQDQEFIFQGIGSSPIVEADQTQLNKTRMGFWSNYVVASYVGVDGNRHRLLLHRIYKRWRNDDLDSQSLLREPETNTLVFGDSNGIVHLDRQDQFTDEASVAGSLTQAAISLNLQSPYSDQGEPALQKNYIHCVLDADTNGQDVTVTLLFNDGESSLVLGTVNTAQRQRVNLPINAGVGYQAYKVSVNITASLTAIAHIYQCGIQYVSLGITRKDFDSYWLSQGIAESKIAKQIFWDYQANSSVIVDVYYDGSETPGFTFTLPATANIRQTERVRLPAVSYRLIRFTASSTSDFIVYPESRIEWKTIGTGKGWEVEPFGT